MPIMIATQDSDIRRIVEGGSAWAKMKGITQNITKVKRG
jgi:hypothetical protein